MPLNLFIIGPKDSGKTTTAKLIAEKYKLTCVPLGEIFVEEMNAKSGFGIEIKKYLDAEASLPDDLIFDVMLSRLKPINFQNFIVSGYPKTLSQARVLEFYFRKNNFPFSGVISLGADDLVKEFLIKKNKLIEELDFDKICLQINKLDAKQ